MKQSYYWSIAIVGVIIIAILVWKNPSQSNMTAPPPLGSVPVQTGTAPTPLGTTPAPVSSGLVGQYYSMAVSKIKPQMLPSYYAQDIASTTLEIHLASPTSDTTVASPFKVTGEVRGSWFFEGNFPTYLTDANGMILASGPAIASSNWMTSDFVPFTATLAFTPQKTGSKGFLILKKDNPSGLAAKDYAVEIAVSF